MYFSSYLNRPAWMARNCLFELKGIVAFMCSNRLFFFFCSFLSDTNKPSGRLAGLQLSTGPRWPLHLHRGGSRTEPVLPRRKKQTTPAAFRKGQWNSSSVFPKHNNHCFSVWVYYFLWFSHFLKLAIFIIVLNIEIHRSPMRRSSCWFVY